MRYLPKSTQSDFSHLGSGGDRTVGTIDLGTNQSPLNPQRPSRARSTENHNRVKYVVPFVDLTFVIFHIPWPLMKNQKI